MLELRSVCKEFGSHLAVDHLSLTVEPGEFFSLVGPSGCGKTTTLRLIAGLEQATFGEIYLNGDAVQSLPPQRRNVSTVFQSYALFPHLNVADNVAFGLRRQGKWNARSKQKMAELLDLLQLTGKEQRMPSRLSGGEKQRVALARSLVLAPDLLLLDEPLSALDPQLRRQVRLELKSLQNRLGITFLLVTHDQEEALALSDRIAVLNGGKLQQIGTPATLYGQPTSRFVAEFLGDINWIGTVGLRPERIRVSAQPEVRSSHNQSGVVEDTIFLGSHTRIRVRLQDGLTCVAECDQAFQPGQPVSLQWCPEDEVHL